MVTVTPFDTRADLAECLAHLTAECRALQRRGQTGTRSQRYAELHGNIDLLLSCYERARE